MRILMVSEDLPTPGMGGLARHALALTRALVAEGHSVDLMGNDDYPVELAEGQLTCGIVGTLGPGGAFFPELRGQFEGWKEMRLGVFMPPKRSLIARRFARAILRRADQYDVIHYHGHLPNLAHYLPRGLNFIQTRHDQGSDCLIHTRFTRGAICTRIRASDCAGCRHWHPNGLQRQTSALAVRRFRHEVRQGFLKHKTVFVSDFLRTNLRRSFGPGDWGVTVHNFIDANAIRAAREAVEPPEPAGPLQVFIAAKLYPAKGVGALLEAIDALGPRVRKSIQLRIAGDGSDEASLRTRFPWAEFLGWQSGDAVLRHAARAHAVVVPSVCEEACASTVLEALMLGKTVFALRQGGTPELAIYAATPTQLRLFDDMLSLAAALLMSRPSDEAVPKREPAFSADAAQAASRLLDLYRRPPGPLENRTGWSA